MFRLAVQMDPIETMVVARDTSLALMLEAQARGAELWWHGPEDIYFDRGRLQAQARRVRVALAEGAHFETLETRVLDYADVDVALIRQDPPFDMGYVSNTYLLERAPAATLVLNHPRGVRNIPEKLATLAFADLTPATLVGRSAAAIARFAAEFEQVVLKPAFLAGGDGVRKGRADDPGFPALVEAMLAEVAPEPLVVQEFLPRVTEGDKRVLVVDGAPLGAVRRLPASGEFRANLHAGGVAVAAELDDRDREIAARIAPLLAAEGILLAGLDVIDGRLTEINLTSPTLAQELRRFSGVDLPAVFWDAALRRLAALRGG